MVEIRNFCYIFATYLNILSDTQNSYIMYSYFLIFLKNKMMKQIYFNLKNTILLFICILTLSVNAQTTVILGPGTTQHGNTDPGPINEFYRSLHSQMVYTAAELNAAGIFGGTMTKLGWYVVSGVTNPLPNYSIKLKHTTAVNASTYDATGLTQYYINSSYSPVAGGFDMLTLGTPFMWNGVDNILLDVCFDQVSAYTSTGVVRTYSTAVTNGYLYVRADGAPQCGVTSSSILNTKPQIQFEFLPPSPLDLGVSAFVSPITSKKCFGNDTIVARLKNFGTASVDFAVNPATITVNTTGPNANTYSLSLTSGTLASTATQDFTISTAFNLATLGTYKLKGFATVVGDGTALNDTTNLTIYRKPIFTTTTLPNDSVCLGVPVQLNANYSAIKQVGTGTNQNSSTSYPTPYGNFYEGAKSQFLYLASELSAAGIVAGNINSISFNVLNLNSTAPYTNFNLAIASSTLTNITAFQSTGLTTYYNSASYTPSLGINTHTFSTPFVWDGVSNIIIETCFDNTSTGYSNNVSIQQSATTFNSSTWYNADSDPTLCATAVAFSYMMQRPNIGLEQPATITYTWSPAIELSATNISNPIANLSTTRTYTVTSDLSGCITYDTLQIYIKPTPTPSLGNDTTFCTLPVILNANTTANSFLWNNGTIGSSLNVTVPGKYWVRGTNSNGCSLTDTIQVGLGTFPIVTLGPDTAFCQGSSINLYAGIAGNTYQWSNGATTPSITVNIVGTYSVIVTNTTGCVSRDTVVITTKPSPSVSLTFNTPSSYCVTDNTVRLLSEGSPAGGTYVGAALTSSAGSTYFNVQQASQGNHIIMYTYTGANGCTAIAKDTLKVNACVGVEEIDGLSSVSIYPNPNNGNFIFELNSSADINGTISILAVDSRVVAKESISGTGLINKTINISNLASGIYYLKFETKNTIKTFKVLKQ